MNLETQAEALVYSIPDVPYLDHSRGVLSVLTKFAQKVIETIIVNASNPFSRPHLRGPTDKEIADLFVPPPF